ncbi:MAG: class I SAM-dependent RNA methyltransferase, partial [bacterium]
MTERRESAASAEEGERLESAEAGAAEATPTAPSTRWVRIEGLASSGEGVGRLPEGRVVFVEGGVPGDRVETVDWVEGKRMARARIGRLLEASPDRVEPRCAHFGVCGGCTWQQIDYPAQCAAKAQIVQDALERIGGLEIPGGLEIEASPEPYAYRARVRLVEEAGRLGFRRRGSREVEAIETCPILVPALEARRREIASQLAPASDPALAPTPDPERVTARAAEPAAEPEPGPEPGPEPEEPATATAPERARSRRRRRRSREWTLVAGAGGAVAGGRSGDRTAARERIELEVLGERLRASASSFVQAHEALRESLAERVRDWALAPFAEDEAASPGSRIAETSDEPEAFHASEASEASEASDLSDAPDASKAIPERFIELHAGIGFFTLPLARAGAAGIALESDRSALADLRANLGRAGLAGRVEVLAGRVERRGDLALRLERADVLIVDPPRTGLDRPVRSAIATSGPRRIVYVSCDPATLARDLRLLVEEGGYRLREGR